MRRKGTLLTALLFLAAGGTLWLSGCGQKKEESMTTVDSTLGSGQVASDVPEPGPTPNEQYTPPSSSTPAPSRRTPRPSPSPSPSPSPRPSRSTTLTVPAGTSFSVKLESDLNTKTAAQGQTFTATVDDPVEIGGQVAIPAGAQVTGHLVASARSGKASGRAYMQLAYDQVSFGGKTYNIEAASDTIWGKGGSGKDAKMIGGGAVAGAVIGGILGKSGGDAAKGAVIGGAAGTAASLLTRGPDLHLEPGKTLNVSLENSVTVTKPKTGA